MKVGPYTLRPHQRSAVEMSRAAMGECISENVKRRVVLQGVCGFGKTIVSSYLMQAALEKGKRPAFMVSGRQLVFQKSEKLADANIEHTVVMADVKGNLRAAASPYDGKHPDCAVISKETYASLLNNHGKDPFSFDLWIIDEAHSAKSEGWWKLIEESPAPVIGLTGTPCWSNGLGMGDRYSKLVISATHEQLIKEGFIVPCRVFAPWGVDSRGVDVNPDSGEYVEKQIEARCTPLVGNFVEEWWRLAGGRTTAFYASSVAHSIAQAEAFRDGDGTLFARPLTWEHVDAETPQAERKRIYDGLRDGDIQGVSNYGVLRQGFDCPAISCIQLGVDMNSLVAFLQSVGRGARPHFGKKDFVVIDHGNNAIESSHGWPQADREWRLDERKPMWERDQEPHNATTRTCQSCGAVYEIWRKVCPECGNEKFREAQMVKTVEGKLTEITPEKPKVLRKDRLSDEQKAFEALYFPSSRSKSRRASTFNQLKARFQKQYPHLRIVQNNGETRVVNLHTKANHRLGYVPEPNSPLWDCYVRDVDRKQLQQPSWLPEE